MARAWEDVKFDLLELKNIQESLHGQPKLDRLSVIKEALDLVVELWPKPPFATVVLETHQWARLRHLLLAIPEVVAADE